MNATAAALGGETATMTSAAGVSTATARMEASQMNAAPPPGAVFASRFQRACAPAASSTSPSASAGTRQAGGSAAWRANADLPWASSQ